MPIATEAELADREGVGEVFKIVFDGITMDRALLSVVKDELLCIHLFFQPKPLKQSKRDQGAGGATTGRPPASDSILKRKRLLPRNPVAERNTRWVVASLSEKANATGAMIAGSSVSVRSVGREATVSRRARSDRAPAVWQSVGLPALFFFFVCHF